jgi:hypothetical protein
MSARIKFFLGILGIVALFSVVQLYGSLRRPGNVQVSFQPQTALANPDDDIDHDGLTNAEESYWNTDFQNADTDADGFKDGEEVASGHNPAIKGPKDFLNDARNINLTEKAASLVAAGVSAQDLKPTSPKYQQALSAVSMATLQDFYNSQPEMPVAPVTIGDGQKNQEEYLATLAKVIMSDLFTFPSSIPSGDLPTQQRQFALLRSQQFKQAYASVLAIHPPKDWAQIHQQVTDLLNRLSANYYSMGNFDKDPLRAQLALSEITTANNQEVKDLLKNITSKIAEKGLNPGGDFYSTLLLIYK